MYSTVLVMVSIRCQDGGSYEKSNCVYSWDWIVISIPTAVFTATVLRNPDERIFKLGTGTDMFYK